MKSQLLCKTYPRLIYFGTFLLVAIMLLTLAVIHSLSGKYLYSVLWLLLALPFVFYLLKMKRLILLKVEFKLNKKINI